MQYLLFFLLDIALHQKNNKLTKDMLIKEIIREMNIYLY